MKIVTKVKIYLVQDISNFILKRYTMSTNTIESCHNLYTAMYKIHIFGNMDFFTKKKLLSECVMNFSKEFLKKHNNANIRTISIDDLKAATAFMDTHVYIGIKDDLFALHDRFINSNEDFAFQIQNLLIIYFNTVELVDMVKFVNKEYLDTLKGFKSIRSTDLTNSLLLRILISVPNADEYNPITMDFEDKIGTLDYKEFNSNPVMDNYNIIRSATQNFMEKYYCNYINILKVNYNFQFIQKYTDFLSDDSTLHYNVTTLGEFLHYCKEIQIMLELRNNCSLMYIINGKLNGQ